MEDFVEEFEDYLPYILLRDFEINGTKFHELLSLYADSNVSGDFFEHEILLNDPFLGVALKVDIIYALITQSMLTIEGQDPLAAALTWSGSSETDPCQEAIDNLQNFLGNNPFSLGSNSVWFVSFRDLVNFVLFHCTTPLIGNNGGTIHDNCERNNRNDREEITGFRIPENTNRKRFRKWERYCSVCRFTYNIRVTAIMISQPAGPPTFDSTSLNIFATYGQLKKNRNLNLLADPLRFFNWKLNEYADQMQYYFVAKHRNAGQERKWNVGFGSGSKFEDNGTTSNVSSNVALEIKYRIGDEKIGEKLIYYCEPITGNNNQGVWYNQGLIRFRLREGL